MQFFPLSLSWLNAFWLLIPILIWNAIFTPRLTQPGWKTDHLLPRWLLILENVLRVPVFFLPVGMAIFTQAASPGLGLMVYIAGTLIYFSSWLPLVYQPGSSWSKSTAGIVAPHLTPLIFLTGISILTHSWGYLLLSTLFTTVHVYHGLLGFGLLPGGAKYAEE